MRLTLTLLLLMVAPMASPQTVDKWGDHIVVLKPHHAKGVDYAAYMADAARGFPAAWYPAAADGLRMQQQPKGLAMASTVVHYGLELEGQKLQAKVDSWLMVRDGEGRVRIESTRMTRLPQGKMAEWKAITVQDQVARCTFQWMTGEDAPKDATVDCLAEGQKLQPLPAKDTPIQEEQQQVAGDDRHLEVVRTGEKKVIEGYEAAAADDMLVMTGTGNRMRREIGVRWYCAELKEVLLLTEPDGKPRWALTEIKKTVPDEALFYPPARMRIVTAAEWKGRMQQLRDSRIPQ